MSEQSASIRYMSALRRLHEAAGSPTREAISRAVSRTVAGGVPKSTWSDWRSGKSIPGKEAQARALIIYLRDLAEHKSPEHECPQPEWWEHLRIQAVAERHAAGGKGGRPAKVPPGFDAADAPATRDGEQADSGPLPAAEPHGPAPQPEPVAGKRGRPRFLLPVLAVAAGAAVATAVATWPQGGAAARAGGSRSASGGPSGAVVSPSSPARSGAIGGTATSPVKVEAVTPLDSGPNNSRALAEPVQLGTAQLGLLNKQYLATGTLPAMLHGVPTYGAYTAVTVVGNESRTVTITGVNVVKDCRPPLTGTLFYSPGQGVGGTIGMGFDLDSRIDYAQDDTGTAYYSGDFFHNSVVTLAPGETRTLSINVETSTQDCRFSFRMRVVSPDRGTVMETIDDNGAPFELTAESHDFSVYRKLYVGGMTSLAKNGTFGQVDPKAYHD